jgi:hypothetical protein
VPGGTTTIRYRGLTTDNQEVDVDPFTVDWVGTGSDVSGVFTAGTDEAAAFPGGCPVIVRQDRGVAHFGSDGDVRYGYAAGSELYVGVYTFGPDQFADSKYGLEVRDQMLAANIGVERGMWLPPTSGFGGQTVDYPTWRTTQFDPLAAQATADFARWSGPWIATGDDFWGLEWPWLTTWATDPHLPDLFNDTASMLASIGNCRAMVLVDEANDRYGNTPLTPASHPNLANLTSLTGGLATMVTYTRDAGCPPVMWGMFGLSAYALNRHYSNFLTTTLCDGIDQYDATLAARSVTYGSHLRTDLATALQVAGTIRDPSRPFSTNFGLIKSNATKQSDGSTPLSATATTVYNLGGQIWLGIGVGATILRGYSLDRFQSLAERASFPAGQLLEYGVRPGDDEFDVLLNHATAVKDYASELLGTETSCPWGGPDFVAYHRVGLAGRVYVAINLSFVSARLPPFALDGLDEFSDGEIVDGATRTELDPDEALETLIPGGAVVILSGRLTTTSSFRVTLENQPANPSWNWRLN